MVKVFGTNIDISLIKMSRSFSVISLHPKIKQCLGLCSQGEKEKKNTEKPCKDFLTYEMFTTKVFTEGKLSFATWL